jgi:hypothetical protein
MVDLSSSFFGSRLNQRVKHGKTTIFLWFSYGFPQLPMVKSQDFRAATSATPFPSALLLVGLEHTVGPPRRFFGFKNSQLLSAKWEMESDGDQ